MREIENKKTEIKNSEVKFQGSQDKLSYKGLIELALDIVPQGGFTPSDIRERNRIQEKLDECSEDIILLEDADYSNLKKIISNSRWTIRSKELSEFLDAFENDTFKKVTPTKKSK